MCQYPMETSGGAGGGVLVAKDFPSLRRMVKKALPGSGRVASAIRTAQFQITERGVTVLIVTCRKRREWRKAVEIFNAVPLTGSNEQGGHPALVPNFYTYSAVISVCSKSGALDTAMGLFREMQAAADRDAKLQPDASIYRLIIASARNYGEYALAVDMYKEGICVGLDLDLWTLECAVMSCMKLGEWRTALDILEKIPRALEREEQKQAEVDGEMERQEAGMCVREQYALILNSCRVSGDVDLAVETMLMMQMMGEQLSPLMCDSVMMAAEVARDTATGLSLLHEMIEHQIEISMECEACLMRLLQSNGKVKEAQNLSAWMQNLLRNGTRTWMAPHNSEEWTRVYTVSQYIH